MRHPVRIVFVLVLASAACGDVKPTDEDADVDVDAPDADVDAPDASVDAPDADVDAPDAAPALPSAVTVSAGGGFTSSAGHRMHVRIGAPQPVGGAQSAGHRITTGPGALPWPTP